MGFHVYTLLKDKKRKQRETAASPTGTAADGRVQHLYTTRSKCGVDAAHNF
jgi:hypothetical protein